MLTGPALLLGDDVNTDILHPSRFYSLNDTTVRSGFLRAVEGRETDADSDLSGRIVIAGTNMGCGSSRETGARVFQLAGVQAVIAISFARIFHRNLLNLGVIAMTCPELQAMKPDDEQTVTVNVEGQRLSFGEHNLRLTPLDPHWKRVINAGGLVPFLGLE